MSQPSPSHIRATAVRMATLRRLALSMLFTRSSTITTNSYQTTCAVSERTFNKRQHANARYRVGLSLFTHYDSYYLVRISLSMNTLSNVSNNFILDFNCKLHVIPMTSLMNRYFFSDTYYVCSVHWFVLYHIVKINTCGYLPHSKAQRFITFLMIVILS